MLLPEYLDSENRKNAMAALQRGTYVAPDPSPSLLAPRVALSKQLKRVVQPRAGGRATCAVVFGEPGSGKTTLVRQAVREAGEGVLYVDVGRGYAEDVEEAVAAALRLATPYESVLRAGKEAVVRSLNGAGGRPGEMRHQEEEGEAAAVLMVVGRRTRRE